MMQYPQATKHGLAAGEAGHPARADWTIDQSWERYTLDELLELARIDFAPLYFRVKGQPDYEPGAVLLIGRLVARGSGAYHAARRGH